MANPPFPTTPFHHHFTFNPKLLLFFLLLFSATSAVPQFRNPSIQYSHYCNDVVPQSTPSPTPISDPKKPTLINAFFNFSSEGNPQSTPTPLRVLSFYPQQVQDTQIDGVYKLNGDLSLRSSDHSFGHSGNFTRRRGLRLVHFRPPKIPVDYGFNRYDFYLSGFWNATSGKLCLVGPGRQRLGSGFGVLKLDYRDNSDIFTSLVNGTLDILTEDDKVVDHLHILGLNLRNYEYKLIEEEVRKNAFARFDNVSEFSLGFENTKKVCKFFRSRGFYELEYGIGGRENFSMPSGMYLNQIECLESGYVRFLLGFKQGFNGLRQPFDPDGAFVAEGKWNVEKRRLEMVGRRIAGGAGGIVDCLVWLSLRFPAVYTMEIRSSIVGEIWGNRSLNECNYFGRLAFRSVGPLRLKNVRYEYTKLEKVKRSCAGRMVRASKGGKYPDGMSQDMMFDMVVRNRIGEQVSGSSAPLFIGDAFPFNEGMFGPEMSSSDQVRIGGSSSINVSYELIFRPLHIVNLSGDVPLPSSVKIAAEGIYDSISGHLCMIGCMRIQSPYVTFGRIFPPDCEILVDVLYPPVNAKSRIAIKGTIESMRNKSDPRYFERLAIVSHSLYANQVKESLWRIDLEIAMVLVSNSLACVFVGLQLFYVKKHPDVLPFISVMMLTVLTLAHMIPLLLNFEAIFLSNHNRQNVYLGTKGWLEVNEVLVRVITMVAFLLEFRLLQLTWSAKNGDERRKILWISEKKVLFLCLPLYLGGALIALLSHLSLKSHGRMLLLLHPTVHRQMAYWEDLKCYAGLILDGFLFPQILFNLFSDARERALSPSFYIGTTIVRLLPHAYDLYRAHSSPFQSVNYIYANPRMDFYSTAWDISICIAGLLFVGLVFLQQQFGGRFFLHKKFRQNVSYEEVPVVSTE